MDTQKKDQKIIQHVQDSIFKKWTNIYWEFILENEDKYINWYNISRNPNITWDIIQANPDKNWKCKSWNPNIFKKDKSMVTRKISHDIMDKYYILGR